MSETANPYGTPAGTQRSWASGDTASGAETNANGVKERVAEATSQLGDAGRETAHEAKDRMGDVAHEAADRTRGLVDRTRTELEGQAATQQKHLASGLRSLGDELGQMAGGTDDPGFASDLVQRTGDATGRAAQWIEDREPGDILREVEDFARRRPGMFIAIAAGAGLLVGRLLRGTKDAPDRDSGESRREQGASSGTAGAASAGSGGAPPTRVPSSTVPSSTVPPSTIPSSTVPPTQAPPSAVPPTQVPPSAFPPPTPGGAAPQTNGGGTYVERP